MRVAFGIRNSSSLPPPPFSKAEFLQAPRPMSAKFDDGLRVLAPPSGAHGVGKIRRIGGAVHFSLSKLLGVLDVLSELNGRPVKRREGSAHTACDGKKRQMQAR